MLGKYRVREEVIGVEVERESKTHVVPLIEGQADVPKVLEDSFVILANNFHQQFFRLHKIPLSAENTHEANTNKLSMWNLEYG